MLADPVTSEADLARLDQQRIRLDTDTKVLQEKLQNKAGDQGDLQMRQQATIAKSVAKKKEDVLYKLEKLTDKRNALRGHAGEVRPLCPSRLFSCMGLVHAPRILHVRWAHVKWSATHTLATARVELSRTVASTRPLPSLPCRGVAWTGRGAGELRWVWV